MPWALTSLQPTAVGRELEPVSIQPRTNSVGGGKTREWWQTARPAKEKYPFST